MIQTRGVDRASTDSSGRLAISTRFNPQGSGVQLYISNRYDGEAQETVLRPLTGVWTEMADELGLRLPGKKPKCMAMDRGRVVVSPLTGDSHSSGQTMPDVLPDAV